MLNDEGHRTIFNIITSDKTYIPFYNVPIRQESELWVFKNESNSTTVKNNVQWQVMYAVFFWRKWLVKAVKFEEQNTVTENWYT